MSKDKTYMDVEDLDTFDSTSISTASVTMIR